MKEHKIVHMNIKWKHHYVYGIWKCKLFGLDKMYLRCKINCKTEVYIYIFIYISIDLKKKQLFYHKHQFPQYQMHKLSSRTLFAMNKQTGQIIEK